jgi:hypothetical protein
MKFIFSVTAGALLALSGSGCNRQPVAQPWLGAPIEVATPAAVGARFPHLAVAPSGHPVVMSWLEPAAAAGEFRLRYAEWQPGGRFGAAVEVAAGQDWFVNWADFPSVVPTDHAGGLVAHWLQQKPGGIYAYDVMSRLSTDGGRTWSEPRSPHDDGTATEHGFVSLATVAGRPYAVWLDGRRTGGEGHGHDDHGISSGAMTLRGATLAPAGAVGGVEIDDRVCDCCGTDVATTRDALLVVYRDRSADETRDIQAARLVDGKWSAPVAVHADGWRIDACPVNGPAVAARGDDVAVAWFTAPDQPRVRLAFSADGGRTFSKPQEVARGGITGRVDVVLLADGRAIVSWLAETPAGAAIRVQPFTRQGVAGPAIDIATAAIARSSGFPQMLEAGDGLLFAWTGNEANPIVHAAFAHLN